MDNITIDGTTFYTIPNAATKLGVTRQRMHELIKTYEIKTVKIHNRARIVSEHELNAIPDSRPDGVHINRR